MDAPIEEPKHLRTLRRLVNALTVVLILGFITVVVVIVIRFASPATPPPEIPENIALPNGQTSVAVTLSRSWVAVVAVTSDGTEFIHIFNLDGSLRDSVQIGAAE